MTMEKAVPVLYLDLDGTVRQGKDDGLGRFVNGPEDVIVFPEAVEMMHPACGRFRTESNRRPPTLDSVDGSVLSCRHDNILAHRPPGLHRRRSALP